MTGPILYLVPKPPESTLSVGLGACSGDPVCSRTGRRPEAGCGRALILQKPRLAYLSRFRVSGWLWYLSRISLEAALSISKNRTVLP